MYDDYKDFINNYYEYLVLNIDTFCEDLWEDEPAVCCLRSEPDVVVEKGEIVDAPPDCLVWTIFNDFDLGVIYRVNGRTVSRAELDEMIDRRRQELSEIFNTI